MTKRELATYIRKLSDSKYTLKECEDLLGFVTLAIRHNIITKDRVTLYGIGTFRKIFVKERPRMNIRKNREVIVPAHYAIKFKACGRLKKTVKKIKHEC